MKGNKLVAILLIACLTGCTKNNKEITIGASSTPHAEILEVAKEQMATKGWKLNVRVMDDYITPNLAVESGDIDGNYFQHTPYLNDFNEKNNTHLVSAGKIHFEPMGIYSDKKTLAEFTSECKIAIPNDTTNKQRALNLLAENHMENADIIEMTAQTIPTILQDVDYAVINGNYALSSNVTDKMLTKENQDSDIAQELANIVAVHESRQNEQWVKDLVEALKSKEAKEFVETRFKGSVVVIGG